MGRFRPPPHGLPILETPALGAPSALCRMTSDAYVFVRPPYLPNRLLLYEQPVWGSVSIAYMPSSPRLDGIRGNQRIRDQKMQFDYKPLSRVLASRRAMSAAARFRARAWKPGVTIAAGCRSPVYWTAGTNITPRWLPPPEYQCHLDPAVS